MPSARRARPFGRDVLSCLQFKTISYEEFVDELERMLDLVGYLGLGIGRKTFPLSRLQLEFSAHLLNAVGVCTERVKDKLVRADRNGRFRWEPTAAQLEPVAVVDDSLTRPTLHSTPNERVYSNAYILRALFCEVARPKYNVHIYLQKDTSARVCRCYDSSSEHIQEHNYPTEFPLYTFPHPIAFSPGID